MYHGQVFLGSLYLRETPGPAAEPQPSAETMHRRLLQSTMTTSASGTSTATQTTSAQDSSSEPSTTSQPTTTLGSAGTTSGNLFSFQAHLKSVKSCRTQGELMVLGALVPLYLFGMNDKHFQGRSDLSYMPK